MNKKAKEGLKRLKYMSSLSGKHSKNRRENAYEAFKSRIDKRRRKK